MRVGILGGSFNPIHNSHVFMAQESLERKLVDEVWILPCKKHAFDKSLVDSQYRVNMIRLAFKDAPQVKVDLTEMRHPGKSYTINTVRKLKSRYPYDFSLIVGGDIIQEITSWNKYKDLLKEVSWIIFDRPDYDLAPVPGMDIISFIEKDIGISSSTLIRNLLRQGKPITGLVPAAVEEYIAKNCLYS